MVVFVYLSAVSAGAEDGKSNHYSVIMVGNSNVGKTSFMRRLLSGTFSSKLPSSVGKSPFLFPTSLTVVGVEENLQFHTLTGLDMCLWPVMVDGKQVVLQLWDTAGQERRVSPSPLTLPRA